MLVEEKVKLSEILINHGLSSSLPSLLYNSPKLLEVSTNGQVNVEISDHPLYNKVTLKTNLFHEHI